MAIYSKVSGIGASSIKGVDGISITNIRAINASLSSAFALLLDERYGFGAEAAYSVRRLSGLYNGPLLVVRRDSDDATLEVGFTASNNLDVSAIETFCGTANGYVLEWRDQSGNLNHARQSVETSQPTIYTGGAIVKENGRVAVDFDGANDKFQIASNISAASNYAIAWVQKRTTASGWLFDAATGRFVISNGSNNLYTDPTWRGTAPTSTAYNVNFLSLVSPSSGNFYENGTNTQSGLTYNQIAIGGTTAIGGHNSVTPSNQIDGILQEFIIFTGDKSTDRTSIESNIGDYFTQNTPLLDTYSGAAAAYSLRKLSSSYSGALVRVREDGTDTQADIYANVFGELDTVSLAAHCGSNNGLVVGWYDQSGNLNNATQPSLTAQPKIYDGTTGVVTDANNKPAINHKFGGTSNATLQASVSYTGSDLSVFCAYENDGTANQWLLQVDFNINLPDGVLMQSRSNELQLYRSSSHISATQAQNKNLGVHIWNGSNLSPYLNGSAGTVNTGTIGTTAFNFSSIEILGGITGSETSVNTSEIIVYTSDQSSNRTGIESNINTFYGIYDTGLIGEYSGAAAAYSLRSLSSVYDGAAITVRRDSDDSTKNIYFDSEGNLDTAALTGFCGNNNGYVVRWFDQSSNNNHATQPSDTAQPKIYDSVTGVVTENGKPAMDTTTAGQKLIISSSTTLTQPYTPVAVSSGNLNNPYHRSNSRLFQTSSNLRLAATTQMTLTMNAARQCISFAVADGASSFLAGSTIAEQVSTTANAGTVNLVLNSTEVGNRASFDNGGLQQELILWTSDQSSNRANIEDNINQHYLIYQPDTAPTSGLLATYSGAAAAYSLRQLSNEAVIAVTVRRDSDDAQANIGFDGRELDTNALTAWCENANGYVVKWWDQSTFGNHATQAVFTAQPKIYDGTTGVVTENGKPAVEFSATSTNFLSYADNTALDSMRTGAFSYIACAKLDTRQRWQQIFGTSGSSTDGEGSLGLQFVSTTANKFGPHNTFIAVTEVATMTLTSQTNRMLVSLYRNGSGSGGGNGATVTAYATDRANNTHTATGTQSWTSQSGNNIYIGKQGDLSKTGNDSWVGTIQEIIAYSSDQSSNRTGIENNIFDFYTGYLLDQYSGAAAAYSLRALSSTATNAVQVRRDSDDATQYIGFVQDAFSLSLDTSALSSFCGSANGYVTEWVDQSGNGNHATQAAFTAQPKIYDSVTGVVTENGKPAVAPLAAQGMSTGLTVSADFTMIAVGNNGLGTNNNASQSYFVTTYAGTGGIASDDLILRYLTNYDFYQASNVVSVASATQPDQFVLTAKRESTTLSLGFNAGTYSTASGASVTSDVIHLMGPAGGGNIVTAQAMQEIIIYDSAQSDANRTGIEDNINGYYDIY